MSTKNERPVTSGAPQEQAGETYGPSYGLARRFDAARRLVRLDCGHYDPLLCYWLTKNSEFAIPGDTGRHLDIRERDAAGRELAAAGWVA